MPGSPTARGGGRGQGLRWFQAHFVFAIYIRCDIFCWILEGMMIQPIEDIARENASLGLFASAIIMIVGMTGLSMGLYEILGLLI
jgi:hypothetical protein